MFIWDLYVLSGCILLQQFVDCNVKGGVAGWSIFVCFKGNPPTNRLDCFTKANNIQCQHHINSQTHTGDILILTPLSIWNHHSKSEEFEPNSCSFFKICENLDQISNSHRFVKICENLAQIPHIFQLVKRCRGVNHKNPSAENGIWL